MEAEQLPVTPKDVLECAKGFSKEDRQIPESAVVDELIQKGLIELAEITLQSKHKKGEVMSH